jgi:hypothetical protein
MTVTDLLQVVPTSLIQAVRNKLLRAFNNLLRANDIRLAGTACCECLLIRLINLVTRQKQLFQNCQQLGTSSANISC